ncbi:MAG: AI-2E family transporter [Nocardiopsaceae bacterium]|nr:AI-2E family transporter [Nocardiopsaceae bacterium]
MSERDPADRGASGRRMERMWHAADRSGVPLRTIVAAVAVVGACYLFVKLAYRLRDVLLMLLVAGFIALILNPLVLLLQRYVVRRRGLAVSVVAVAGLVVFLGLAFAFGYPLVNAITHLAERLPSYVASATHGKGWIGHLVEKYHVHQWVSRNAPKLVAFAQGLSKPALSFGQGALSLLAKLATIFVLVLLLLLEGQKMRRGALSLLSPGHAAEASRVASEMNRAVVGYMVGNFLTSAIAGLVVFITLLTVGVPFPALWALWVALVDFLPMIGGALAGIPTVLFAATHSLGAAVVTLIVFLVYTQIENHILNPIVMSKTVRISPLLVMIAVLVGASVGDWIGGLFGGFVAALLAIPAAGALQVVVREAWRITGPPEQEPPDQEPSPERGSPEPGQAREPGQSPRSVREKV